MITFLKIASIIFLLAVGQNSYAQNNLRALPTGGNVVAGNASITQSNLQVNIHQTSQRAVVTWDNFIVGKEASVNFNQPNASAVTLNRVTGGSESIIDGAVKANGQVILVNPNGVTFGKGAQVDAAGVVASTLDISNKNFMEAKSTYSGNAKGAVVNQGTITANTAEGYIAMLAPEVRNEGYLLAKKGQGNTIAMASGEKITLDFRGDQLLSVKVDQSTYKGLIDNKRLVEVQGGLIVVAAGTAGRLMATTINNTGVVSASSAVSSGGIVHFVASSIQQAGTVTANGTGTKGGGGSITLVGDNVMIAAGSQTVAKGAANGGVINIGTSGVTYTQNADGVRSNVAAKDVAQTTRIENEALVDASATVNGHGGRINVWSSIKTTVAGTLKAMGGSLGGDGGLIETSSKTQLVIEPTAAIITSAPKGKVGKWLLEANVLTIDPAAARVISMALGVSNVAIDVNASTAGCPGIGTCKLNGSGSLAIANGADILKQGRTLTSLSLSSSGALNLNANIVGENLNLHINSSVAHLNAGTKIQAQQVTIQAQRIYSNGIILGVDSEGLGGAISLLAQAIYISRRVSVSSASVLSRGVLDPIDPTTAANDALYVSNQGTPSNVITLNASQELVLYSGAEVLANGTNGQVSSPAGAIYLSAPRLITESGSLVQANGNNGPGGVIAFNGSMISLAGTVQASGTDGGSFAVNANTLTLYQSALVQTNGSTGRGGGIQLSANNGSISLTGALESIGATRGGNVLITANHISLENNSSITATGNAGGGTVLVGGDWQGGNGVYQATTVTMNGGAVIDASALTHGDGGKVVLWSNIHNANSVTQVNGRIFAKAGLLGGNGGQVETSGRLLNIGDTISVSTKSALGLDGEWLLDPEHLWIRDPSWAGYNYTTTGTTTYTALAANTAATILVSGADTRDRGPSVDGVLIPGVTVIRTDTIVNALNSGNVKVLATGLIDVSGWQAQGTPNFYINSTTTNKLSLEAGTSIYLNAGAGNKVINLPSGTLELLAGTSISQASTEGGSFNASTLILGKCVACSTNPSVTLTNAFNQISNLQASNVGSVNVVSSTALAVNASNMTSTGSVSLTSTSTVTLTGSITTTDAASGNVSIQATVLAGSGNVALASGRVLSVNQSGTSTYSGVISGSTSTFTKLGAGALSLTGANTYSGGTLISAGTLQVGNGSNTGSLGSGNVTNNAALKFDLSADTTVANNISGTGTLEVVARFNRFYDATSGSSLSNSTYVTIDTNTTVAELLNRISGGSLHGVSTSSGTAGVESGVNNKSFNAVTNTGSFYILFQDANYTKRVMVLLQQSGANVQAKVDSSGFEFLGNTSTALLNPVNTQAFNGDMVYAVNAGVDGYGLRALDRSSKITFTGNLTHTGATTLTSLATAASAGLCGTASIVCVRYVNPTLQVAGGLSNSAVTNNGNLIFANSSAQTYAGVLSGSGVLINNAAADLTLSAANTFSGNVFLQAGKVIAGNNAAFGTAPIYQVSGLASTVDLNGKTISNNFYLLGAGTASAGTMINGDTSNAATVSGAVTLSANSSLGGAGNFTLGGIVSGSGIALTKIGDGTLTLSGANTYTGATTLTGGTLSVATLASGGLSNNLGASTNVAANLVFNGGTLAYTGSAVSTDRLFTVTDNGGTINASGTGALNFTNTGAIAYTGTSARALTLAGSNTGDNTLRPVFANNTGLSSLTKTGAGTWLLTGTNTYTGVTTISGGVLSVGTLANGGTNSHIGASTNVASNLVLNGGTLKYTGAAVSSDRLFTLSENGGTIDVSGTGALTFTNAGSIGYAGTTTRSLNLIGSGTATLSQILGDNTGATSLTKSGTGTWTQSGTNIYTGTTTISAGILSIATDRNMGAVPSATTANSITLSGGVLQTTGAAALDAKRGITLTAASGLAATSGNSLTLNGIVDGAFALAINSGSQTGTVTLSGENIYSGTTTVTGGTLSGGSASLTRAAFGSGAITVGTGATLLTDRSTLSNNLTLNGGTLQGTNGFGEIWNGMVALTGATTFNAGSSITLNGVISGTGSATKTGAGVLTLTGANTYAGGTTVSGGTLKAGISSVGTITSGAFGSGLVTVQTGYTVDLNGFNAANAFHLSGAGLSSNGALINSSATAVTASGAVTVAANTSIGGSGAINMSGAISASTNTVSFVNGASVTAENTSNSVAAVTITNSALSLKTTSALTVNASSLSGATTLQTVSAGKDITISGAITNNANANALTLMASRDILVSATISGAINQSLTTNFYSDVDNTGGGGFKSTVSTASISTYGGNITIGGGTADVTSGCGASYSCTAGYASYGGVLADHIGVLIWNSLNAAGGNISIYGRGDPTLSSSGVGIWIDFTGTTLSTSGTGTITLNGVSTGANYGIYHNKGDISAGTGLISMTATAGSTTAYSGYKMVSGAITSSGALSIVGTGGSAEYGVYLSGAGSITVSGDITINGQNASRNWGVSIEGSKLVQTTAGNISVTAVGTGGFYLVGSLIAGNHLTTPTAGGTITINATGNSNFGLQISTGSLISKGAISITAATLSGAVHGFRFEGASGVVRTASDITIQATSTDWAMTMYGSRIIQSTGGNISVTASGGGGLYVQDGGGIVASNDTTSPATATPATGGTLTINATGTSWYGIQMANGSLISNGAMSVTARGAGSYQGAYIYGVGTFKAVGNITIDSATSGGQWGFDFSSGRVMQSTTGNISIASVGNYGMYLNGSIVASTSTTDTSEFSVPSAGGLITISATGRTQQGLEVAAGSLIANNSISITGSATGAYHGVKLAGAGSTKAVGGITINATTTGAQWAFYQTDSRFIQSTTGNIAIAATATTGYGIYMYGGGLVAGNSTTTPTNGGGITINSTSGANDIGGAALRMDANSTKIIAYGDITIYANGASAGLNVANQQGHGVILYGSSQVIRSYGGDLSITGYATRAIGSADGWANISGGITLWNDSNTLRAYGGLTLKGVSMQGIGVYLTVGSSSGGSVTADTGNIVINGLSNSAFAGTYVRIPVVATAGSVSISGAGAGEAGLRQDGYTGTVSANTDITMTGYNTSGGYGLQLTTGSVTSSNGTITFSGYTASTNTGHYGVYSTVNASAVSGSVNFQGSKMNAASTGSGYLVNAAGTMSGGTPNIPAPLFAVADSVNPAFAATNGVYWTGAITANTASGYIQINSKAPSVTGLMTAYGLALLSNNQSYTINNASNAISSLAASIGTGSLNFVTTSALNIGTYNGVAGITAASVTLSAGGLTDTNDAGITVTSSSTIAITNASGSYDYSGVIAGPIALTKSGAGTQTLSAANSYTGLTSISAGTLRLGANGTSTNTPLGTTAAGTSITAGATLDLNGYTLGTSEALTLNGYGVSSNGALINSSASTPATYSGTITVGSASYIGGAGTMTLSGAVGSASYGVGFVGAGSYTLSNTGNTLSTIATSGIGSLTLKNNAALTIGTVNTISGMTFSDNAALDVTGNITMSALTIQKNGSADSTLILKSSARVNLWHGNNQIKTNTEGGTGKLNMIFWSESDGGNTHGTSLAGTFTTNGGHIWAGGGSGSTTWNGLTVGNGAAGAGGDNAYAIDTQGTWTTSGGSIWLAGNVGTGAGYDLAIANGAAQVFNVGAGSITLIGDYQYIGTTSVTSTGALTIAPYGSAFTDGSGVIRPFTWSGSGTPNFAGTGSIANLTINSIANLTGLVIGKSNSTANANVTISNAIGIAGPISIYGGNIVVSQALTTTGSTDNAVTLLASDSIKVSSNITTSGAAVLISSNSDSDSANGGAINMNAATVSTSGGSITLGGGTDGSGYAEGSASAIQDSFYRGIWLSGTTLNAGSGNIVARGKGWQGATFGSSSAHYSIGIDLVVGTTLRTTGSGNITLIGVGGINYTPGNHSVGINFYTSTTGNSLYTVNGNVSLTGTAGTGTARTYAAINNDGGVAEVYSTTGNVSLTGNSAGSDYGLNVISGATLYTGYNSAASVVTTGNILIQSNRINASGAINFRNTGTITVEPIANSFTSAFSWPPTNVNLVSTAGLTIGKSTNTADITIATATSVAGPVALYGGAININAALISTGTNTITLKGSGNVTDGASGYVVASNLLLLGGNVTLDNAANNAVSTLAASGITGLTFANKNALSIGTVGDTNGLSTSEAITVSTFTGDLTVSQNITTSNTGASAMTFTAGSNTASGTSTGGNVVLSGTPSLTTGTNGRTVIYTGSVNDSTGITSFVGSGTGNFRYNSKVGTTNFTTVLGTSGKYAVYRQAVVNRPGF